MKGLLTMKKVIVGIMFILLITILTIEFTSQNLPQEPPQITITIEDKELEYVVGKNQWDGSIYDRKDTFKTILKKGSESEIPYIEIGNTATISFKNSPPSKFTISDILIDKNGNQRYSDKEIINIPVELKHGKCSFEIKKHLASGLSSHYVEGKTDIRGFKMIATWGENECEYGFIIRTDSF